VISVVLVQQFRSWFALRSDFCPAIAARNVAALFLILMSVLSGCLHGQDVPTNATPPTPDLEGITGERRQVRFVSEGVTLAGELDLPTGDAPAPLVFVIHHSGPVTRDAYGYLAELLLEEGYAVFRFDKRGTGASEGTYGCCESEDALAAYRAATAQDGFDPSNVFIVAQSIGTQHLAERFEQYVQVHRPRGVVLLSNLLDASSIDAIAAPIYIIVSDSEANLDAIGPAAAEAHRNAYSFGASYYIAEGTEHNLFDISTGPIDWDNPEWVQRYHVGAMQSLIDWLDHHRVDP
jgi:pimeloyl-ACP methyl ester carboxylesterase